MAKHLEEYARYWVKTHFDDLNAQPDPTSFVQWSGAKFKSPLDSKEQMEVFGDLSATVRNAVFKLHTMARNRENYISSVAEYREDDLDHEGPIAVAEMVIAADETFRVAAREARLKDAMARGNSVDWIKSWLEKAKQDWAATQEQQRKSAEQMMRELGAQQTKPGEGSSEGKQAPS